MVVVLCTVAVLWSSQCSKNCLSLAVSHLALESGPSNSFPSPLSVSLDIVVSFGSWFATPLGVDLVSANLYSSFVPGSVVDRKECVSACHACGDSTCRLRDLYPQVPHE